MTLQDLGNVGEFVAAIAVVVSLVYLPTQVRHGTRQTEANTRAQNLSALVASQEHFGRRRSWFVRDPELYELWERGLRDLDDLESTDRLRFQDLMADLLFTSQVLYVQHREGMVYTEGWEGLRVILGQTFATPGGASSISMIAPMPSANFRAEIRAAALEQSEGESADPRGGNQV